MLKLCSSLELFQKVAQPFETDLSAYIDEVLKTLAKNGVRNLELFVDYSKPFQDLSFKEFEGRDAERLLSGGHVLLVGGAGRGKTLLIRSKFLPWLHASGAHFVVCDYHGDYAADLANQVLSEDEFEHADRMTHGLKRCIKAAFDSSVVISHEGSDLIWEYFIPILIAEVIAGRGPKSPWFLIIDLSSHAFNMPALLDFIPVAKIYGCTLIITSQRLVEFKPYLFSDIAFLNQFSAWGEDDHIAVSGGPRSLIYMQSAVMRAKIEMLQPLQFMGFSMGGASQGYRLTRTPGYGTHSDPVLPS
jgi:hypothetical protein